MNNYSIVDFCFFCNIEYFYLPNNAYDLNFGGVVVVSTLLKIVCCCSYGVRTSTFECVECEGKDKVMMCYLNICEFGLDIAMESKNLRI